MPTPTNQEDVFKKYIEAVNQIVLVLDVKGTILSLNKRGHDLLGYPDGELVGKNWVTEILSKNKHSTQDIFMGTVTNKYDAIARFDYDLVVNDGKEKSFTWGSAPVRDSSGVIQSYVCTGDDMSELKKAEIDLFHLKELDRLKDEFLNIVAHELKTPLTSIIALSDLLRSQKSQLPENVASYPDIIFEEGMRLKHVVKRILTVTRYESGKDVVYLERISINTFFQSLLPVLQTLNQKRKYSVQIQEVPGDLQIETDKEKISEVVINLVDNAVKYGRDNQTIMVSIGHDTGNNMLKVEVADQGPGIPPESMSKLFNKFSQLEPSLSRSQEGIGLGLYICKFTIERLGGRIEVQSEVGKGSKFIFYLPITYAPKA